MKFTTDKGIMGFLREHPELPGTPDPWLEDFMKRTADAPMKRSTSYARHVPTGILWRIKIRDGKVKTKMVCKSWDDDDEPSRLWDLVHKAKLAFWRFWP